MVNKEFVSLLEPVDTAIDAIIVVVLRLCMDRYEIIVLENMPEHAAGCTNGVVSTCLDVVFVVIVANIRIAGK